MHFTWDVSFGQIMITMPIAWIVIMIFQMYRMLLNFRIEHEMLMLDWASRQNPKVRLNEIPTRRKKW